jgi:hypothetical protein
MHDFFDQRQPNPAPAIPLRREVWLKDRNKILRRDAVTIVRNKDVGLIVTSLHP